ncbi:hypothetical protein OHA46_33270 (plasmid) [Streptomyces sp. NBC_00708]
MSTGPAVTAAAMARAAELAGALQAVNVITSKGVEATQTVFPPHIHVVPAPAATVCRCPGRRNTPPASTTRWETSSDQRGDGP